MTNKFHVKNLEKYKTVNNSVNFVFLSEYRAAFYLFDRDCNGFVTTKELGSIMRTLGFNPNEEDLQQMIFTVDYDGRYNIFDNLTGSE